MSERGEASRDGARLQPNSGRGKRRKGDAILDDYVVDYKEYGSTFGISEKVWAKVCTDAFKVGLDYKPLIKLVLNSRLRLAILDWDEFETLKEKARKYDECRE